MHLGVCCIAARAALVACFCAQLGAHFPLRTPSHAPPLLSSAAYSSSLSAYPVCLVAAGLNLNSISSNSSADGGAATATATTGVCAGFDGQSIGGDVRPMAPLAVLAATQQLIWLEPK